MFYSVILSSIAAVSPWRLIRARLAEFLQSAPDLRQLPHRLTSQEIVYAPSKAQTLDTIPHSESDMASPNQLAANRANAQLSAGPTSSEGNAKISHNALKTGLTGRTVLLPI